MSKQKTYGPSPGTDEKELILARMIGNAKSRGLGFCTGNLYRNADGKYVGSADGAVSCCAMGAFLIDKGPHLVGTGALSGVSTGNDSTDITWANYCLAGEDIGHAYREAMTNDASPWTTQPWASHAVW